MNGETSQEPSLSIVNTLSLAIVLGYMAAMPMWMWYPPAKVPPEILAIINQMMGAWGMAFATVVAFHLGSSRDTKSAQQSNQNTMATLSSTVASTAATAATVATTAAVAAGVTTNGALETAGWNEAVVANTPEAFDTYLGKFPTGIHAAEAKTRLAALRSA